MPHARRIILVIAAAWVLLVAAAPRQTARGQAIVGSWRTYSERLFYDAGGAGAVIAGASTKLEILQDGTWTFGSATGKWRIAPIAGADWKRWGSTPYGPTRRAAWTSCG